MEKLSLAHAEKEAQEPKTGDTTLDTADAVSKMFKSPTLMILLIAPAIIRNIGVELKEKDSERFYALKGHMRHFLKEMKEMKEAVPEYEKALTELV